MQYSRRVRAIIHERLHQFGSKASKIFKGTPLDPCRVFSFLTTARPDLLEMKLTGPKIPPHRIPKRHHVINMMPAARRRDRLDRDPFVALHLLVKRNKERVF